MKFTVTENHANQIDSIVINTKVGELIEFGDVGLIVFGKTAAGAVVGNYVYDNRDRLPGWWRVVNGGGHPVADAKAITLLESEGHQMRNGVIVGYKRNPQANIMKANGVLDTILNTVDGILRSNRLTTLSSNQLYNLLPISIQSRLIAIAGGYNAGACKDPASYVGTAAAMLAKRNPTGIVHDIHYRCPVLNRFDDAFRML